MLVILNVTKPERIAKNTGIQISKICIFFPKPLRLSFKNVNPPASPAMNMNIATIPRIGVFAYAILFKLALSMNLKPDLLPSKI